MKPGSVIVDVAIDQRADPSQPSTSDDPDNPSYVKHGVVHYSVANKPGAVPRTSHERAEGRLFLTDWIADKGLEKAVLESQPLMKGLNVYLESLHLKGVETSWVWLTRNHTHYQIVECIKSNKNI
jgi:alanine dehydrogenase